MVIDANPNPNINKNAQNRDPLTGEPGAHPIGTALGAGGAASAGAVIGAVAGPVGSVAGAVVGAIAGGIVGGFAGSGIAELVNPTAELEYWEHNYTIRPYVSHGENFETYKPAYKYGYESRAKNPDASYDAVRTELQTNWQANKSDLDWTRAEPAIRDAYDRTGSQLQQRSKAFGNTGANQPGAKNNPASTNRPGSPDANASGYAADAYGSANNSSGNKNNAA